MEFDEITAIRCADEERHPPAAADLVMDNVDGGGKEETKGVWPGATQDTRRW